MDLVTQTMARKARNPWKTSPVMPVFWWALLGILLIWVLIGMPGVSQ
jgi:hypothetical protein